MALARLPVRPAPEHAGGRRESRELPGQAASVPKARRFVRDVLAAWDRGDVEEAGTLLASELVGNAVLHARSAVRVLLVEIAGDVMLVVGDESPALPVVRRHSREAATGRGLWLLDQFSSEHGVDVTGPGSGKQVWALLCPEVGDPTTDSDAGLALWLHELDGL